MSFEGKVVFVTGASRGIGEYTAYEFASLGANVALMAKTTKDEPHRIFTGTIEETAEKVRSYGVEVLAVKGDVSHEEDVRAAYDATMDAFGRCDVLVNNAAVSFLGPFLEVSVKRWQIIMAVNVLGPVLTCRQFLPQMIERGEGRIINIGSGSGRLRPYEASPLTDSEMTGATSFGAAGQSLGDSQLAYGTSKAALNRFTIGLAQEMRGLGVAVNSIDVSAATQPYRNNLPNADLSQNELEEGPSQLITWLAGQPISVTGNLFDQTELLRDLRAQGLVRPKVIPT